MARKPTRKATTATTNAVTGKRTARRPVLVGSRARPSGKPAHRRTGRGAAPSHEPTAGLDGWITHTDLASTDPAATRAWCEAVMTWQFRPPMPGPGPEYHLFIYSPQGGGGIRRTEGGESPGCVPFVHVPDTQAAFDAAVAAGARAIQEPTRVMEGVTIASVRAPGGVVIGFSGP